MQSLTEEQFTTRAPCEGIDILMRVTRAETSEQHAALVGFVIAISVFQMQQVIALPDVCATVPQRETGRHVQAIGED